MPTLELLLLQLKPSISPTSPTLLSVLSGVRAHVKTSSRFYTSLEDSSLLYILGEWPSLDAHTAFLDSSEREAVLKQQDDLAGLVSCAHFQMVGSMAEVIALDAKVLVLDRRWVKPDRKSGDAFEKVARRYAEEVETGSEGTVFGGWRVDPRDGETEYVMLSGWGSKQQHLEWRETTRRDVPEYVGVGRCYDVRKGEQGVEVRHLRDVERMVEEGERIR